MRETPGKAGILPQMSKYLLLLLLFLALLISAPARDVEASQYSQSGFYEPEVIRLANGLTIILKPRGEAPNVAIRLVAGVGHDDFPKGAKQTAHMVEHLFYMGTSRHDETEIDRLIQDHGGYSNAFTGSEETIHHLNIFNQHYLWGLDLLFELLTDASFSEAQVKMAAEVIAREEGGVPSPLHRWLYEHDITKPPWEMAYERLLPNPGYQFGLESCENIGRSELWSSFRRYYVPANMTLIVVGKFERAELLSRIMTTFGSLSVAPPPQRRQWILPFPNGPAELDGTLAPVLDSEGNVELMFRTDGVGAPDYYALQVIGKYLDRKVFEELRFKRGLAYDSGSSFAANRKWGMLAAGGTVEIGRMQEVRQLLEAEIDRLRAGKVAMAEVDKVKQQILLAQANGYESNAEVADYYANNLAGLQTIGRYQNYEDAIAAVTTAQVTGAAARYLQRDRAVLVMSRPAFTVEKLSFLLMVVTLLSAILIVRAISHYRKRKNGANSCRPKM